MFTISLLLQATSWDNRLKTTYILTNLLWHSPPLPQMNHRFRFNFGDKVLSLFTFKLSSPFLLFFRPLCSDIHQVIVNLGNLEGISKWTLYSIYRLILFSCYPCLGISLLDCSVIAIIVGSILRLCSTEWKQD